MLRQARERLPGHTFIEANVSHWAPPVGTDVVFWLPRLIHFVVLGGMPVKDFLYATDCAPVRA